jgi:hypothetical protein
MGARNISAPNALPALAAPDAAPREPWPLLPGGSSGGPLCAGEPVTALGATMLATPEMPADSKLGS